MRGIDRIADHLEREIGFNARAHVESTVVEKRPATMCALDAAQIGRDLRLERVIDLFAQIVPQQHIFRRDRRVGFELEHPVPVRALQTEQRLRRRLDALRKRGGRG